MSSQALLELQKTGQSIWFDNISRDLIESGELERMIKEDGLLGVTSNPSIFEKAIAGSADYDSILANLVEHESLDAKEIYERVAIADIQEAADLLLPVYEETDARDGYVSLEVSPYRANDTAATLEEARRLYQTVDRNNVMIKVPATPAGLPAIEQLIADGIPVNVTLLFSVDAYKACAEAYVSGLEQLAEEGGDVTRVASVASFFISRIDSLLDSWLEEHAATLTGDAAEKCRALCGQVAIANARVAYSHYQELVASERWQRLVKLGAQPQRLLWASTSTKNPSYPSTMYVHALNGPETVNTLPTDTYHATRAEAKIRAELVSGQPAAPTILAQLAEFGISLEQGTDQLLAEGVSKFSDAFDNLLAAVEDKRAALLQGRLARMAPSLGAYQGAVDAQLEEWRSAGTVRSLWQRDTSIWSGADEDQWLGWLDGVRDQLAACAEFEALRAEIQEAGFQSVVLLGMGGSSLCPWVVRETFGQQTGAPELHVLDSIVPAQVQTITDAVDPASTVFIVASKSGSTTEPNVLMEHFLEQVAAVDPKNIGAHFIAVTDPGSDLEAFATQHSFRAICRGEPSIGGRYSAFSPFGMVPSALMGVDVQALLDSAQLMAHACGAPVPPSSNPGVQLGVIFGTLAQQGRDKITVVAAPAVASIGAWLEQLIAESTGKLGKGLIPVAEENLGAPQVYGQDRVFVYLREKNTAQAETDLRVDALEHAGHPVVRIHLDSRDALGQEFFRWEIATAAAGSVLGINPFDQPDVEASKIATRSVMEQYADSGALPTQDPIAEENGIRLYADDANAAQLRDMADDSSVAGLIAAHLQRLEPGDYFAINAYVEMDEVNHRELQAMRHAVRDGRSVATTVGYGPRFLHSTGQLHKGGPNTGVFLQVTSDDAAELPIPGREYSFGILKQAQALGDFDVLAERNRRALRVHLGPNVQEGLATLKTIIRSVIA
ncbi:MAG: bifunctional transaldolase/phosoglucose isomerase [Planctomycetota bacterium]